MYSPYVQRAVDRALLPNALQFKGLGWPRGGHFLVSEETQLPIEEVLHFLRDHYLSRLQVSFRKSPRSLAACVYDLKDYYDFLDFHGLKAMEVRISHLEDYVLSMRHNKSTVTGRDFARATVRRRASNIRSFYAWASRSGLTKHRVDLDKLQSVANEDARYGEENGDRVSIPKPQRPDTKVRFIPTKKLRAILSAAGPLTVDTTVPGQPESGRLRLMLECALQTGLRRFEIPSLELKELEKGLRLAKDKQLLHKSPIELLGKGGEYRTVMFPIWLIRNLGRYVAINRNQAMNERRAMDPSFTDHGFVFVHDAGSGTEVGSRFSDRYLSEPIRQLQLRIGIRVGESSEEGPYQRLYGVHALRHTYAVMEYFSRKEAGDSEPWLYVQAQLGHRNLKTTTDIYLAIVNEYEYEFGQLLKAGIRQVVYG